MRAIFLNKISMRSVPPPCSVVAPAGRPRPQVRCPATVLLLTSLDNALFGAFAVCSLRVTLSAVASELVLFRGRRGNGRLQQLQFVVITHTQHRNASSVESNLGPIVSQRQHSDKLVFVETVVELCRRESFPQHHRFHLCVVQYRPLQIAKRKHERRMRTRCFIISNSAYPTEQPHLLASSKIANDREDARNDILRGCDRLVVEQRRFTCVRLM